ncbi:MAG: ABC transporter ATP-binding protein, partial [Caldilineae bacterium]
FVLISHNMDMVRRYCRRGIWLQDGQIQADGDVERVTEAYLTALYTERHRKGVKQMRALSASKGVNRWGTGEIEIERVEFLDGGGQPCTVFRTGEPFILRMHYVAAGPVEEPVFGIALFRADGTHINGPNTKLAKYPLPVVQGRGYVDYAIEALNLLPGAYEASVAVYDTHIVQAYDHQHRLHRFQVLGGDVAETRGVVYLPSRWAHVPADAVEEAALPVEAVVE